MFTKYGNFNEIEMAYALGEDPNWPTEEDLQAELPAREAPVGEYLRLQEAYDYFNAELFGNRLPPVMFTLRGKGHQIAYAQTPAFVSNTWQMLDEIAMNPQFTGRDGLDILSTIVHEMVHIEQFNFGKPSNGGYHNKEWVGLMQQVGLKPFNTKDPGKQTGTTVSHTIIADGLFEAKAKALLDQGWTFNISEASVLANVPPELRKAKDRAKQKRKTKYTCDCSTVWGKPGLNIMCCECGAEFEEQE